MLTVDQIVKLDKLMDGLINKYAAHLDGGYWEDVIEARRKIVDYVEGLAVE